MFRFTKVQVLFCLMVLFFIASPFGICEKNYYQQEANRMDVYVDDYAVIYKNGKYGFVDKNNEFVVPPIYTMAQNAPGDYFFVCKDTEGEKCAYMHKKTKKLLTDYKYMGCGNGGVSEGFSEGRAKFVIVDEDGQWKSGYINKKGEEVIPAIYYDAYPFKNGKAEVKIKTVNENGESEIKSFVINKSGKVIKELSKD